MLHQSIFGIDKMDINTEPICNERIIPRKIRPQNIVCHLINREHGLSRRPGTHSHTIRDFYKCIYPNLTVINVEKPPGFLRKFSPDGKYLIAFTLDQTALEIYQFNGVVAAAQLINSWKKEVVPNDNTDLPYTIRNQIFEKLFKVCVMRSINKINLFDPLQSKKHIKNELIFFILFS